MAGIASWTVPYVVVITNGPPDNKTFDRRRVDPSAGCRAAAEPATLPVRWSVRYPTVRPFGTWRSFHVQGGAGSRSSRVLHDKSWQVQARHCTQTA